jgi:hypothetical protein
MRSAAGRRALVIMTDGMFLPALESPGQTSDKFNQAESATDIARIGPAPQRTWGHAMNAEQVY